MGYSNLRPLSKDENPSFQSFQSFPRFSKDPGKSQGTWDLCLSELSELSEAELSELSEVSEVKSGYKPRVKLSRGNTAFPDMRRRKPPSIFSSAIALRAHSESLPPGIEMRIERI